MHAPSPDLRMAELVAARLCHEFGSPLSTLTAIMPQAAEASAHAVLTETVAELRLRHALFGALYGQPDELEWSSLAVLLGGAPVAHRVRFSSGEPPPGDVGAATIRLLLGAMLLGGEALPRGGSVRLTAGAGGGFAVLAEGRDAVWPSSLSALLAGGRLDAALADGPRRVLVPWVLHLAAADGRVVGLDRSGGAALPALTLSPRR